MKRLEPTFLRRFQVYADIQGKNKSVIQEPVAITLGFTGPIDPDSGMIVNLTDIDAWIEKFKSKSERKSYSSRWEFCKQSKRSNGKISSYR